MVARPPEWLTRLNPSQVRSYGRYPGYDFWTISCTQLKYKWTCTAGVLSGGARTRQLLTTNYPAKSGVMNGTPDMTSGRQFKLLKLCRIPEVLPGVPFKTPESLLRMVVTIREVFNHPGSNLAAPPYQKSFKWCLPFRKVSQR